MISVKTRYKIIIGIIVACLAVAAGILSACHGRLKMDILTEAEAFLPAEPDSADARLRQMDMKRSGKEEVALYSLLRTVTDAIKGDSVPDEEFVNAAYSFYAQESHNGSASTAPVLKRFAQSALYMGDWYARLDSVKAAEDCYRQAISASERCEDWHTCYVSLQRLAEQVKWGNEEEALRLIERAIAIYDNCNDNIQNKLSLHDCAANYKLEMAYFTGSSYQDAIDEANKEYELAKSQHLPEYENQALRTLAHIYRINDDHIRALSYAKKIKIQDSNHAMLWMSELASCYLACDSLDQARGLYHLLVQSSDKKDRYLAICGLTEVAIQLGDRDSAVFYMDSAFRCSEAMYMDALQAKDDYYQETLKQEREKDLLMLKTKLRIWSLIGALLLMLAVGLFAARIYRLRSKMYRQEKQYLQNEMRLLQEKQEVMAESLHKKEAAIRYLQKYIIERAEMAAILIEGTHESKISKKDWSDIEHLLDEIDDQRISTIRTRHPEFGIDDIHLCILVRLQLSNPRIGQIYGITPSAVQHRKQTLKKKGFGITDPETSLDDVLESLA